jgi:hypothetical protein
MKTTHFTASCAVLLALLVAGCAANSGESTDAQYPEPVVAPPVSINAVMVALVDHAAHELWNVEQEGGAPTTEREWALLEHHAIQLAAAGSVLVLGGTGPADPGWARLPDWIAESQAMSDAGAAARDAIRARDLDALVAVNGQLVETCVRCHDVFKPELPTEGIIHLHEH